jgi:hypothetical protein
MSALTAAAPAAAVLNATHVSLYDGRSAAAALFSTAATKCISHTVMWGKMLAEKRKGIPHKLSIARKALVVATAVKATVVVMAKSDSGDDAEVFLLALASTMAKWWRK